MQKIYKTDDLLFDVDIFQDESSFNTIPWSSIKELTIKIWTTDESNAKSYTLDNLIQYKLPIPSTDLSDLSEGIFRASYSIGVESSYFPDGVYNRSGEIQTNLYLV
jgi:hypothetical protein